MAEAFHSDREASKLFAEVCEQLGIPTSDAQRVVITIAAGKAPTIDVTRVVVKALPARIELPVDHYTVHRGLRATKEPNDGN